MEGENAFVVGLHAILGRLAEVANLNDADFGARFGFVLNDDVG